MRVRSCHDLTPFLSGVCVCACVHVCLCVGGLKTNQIYTHLWPVVLKGFRGSELTATLPFSTEAHSHTRMLPRTPGEEPVCVLDDGLDDPDDLQRDRGHHFRDVPVSTGQSGAGRGERPRQGRGPGPEV